MRAKWPAPRATGRRASVGKNLVEIIVTAEDKASGVLKGVGDTVSGIGRAATGVALGVGGALVAGMGMAGAAAIDMNSQLETSTLQFETLMGDADRADAHVRGLFDFAAKTPFETGPIIEASRIMQVFGGDALNTDENLTRIGNTAAAVGAPIEDIGFWVGRAYAAIQGGQPFGEAAQNLMQMGAVSPATVAEMQRLQESGASTDEIFAVMTDSMDGYAGAMEKQAGTFQGMASTLKDSFNMMAAEAMKPLFDLVKTGMSSLATWLNSPEVQAGIQRIATGFTQLIERVAAFVTESVIPFVQQHGEALKNILLAIGVIMLATLVPAAISLVASMLPIILIVMAVAGVIALLRTAWEQNWGGIQEKVAGAWAAIQPVLQTVWDWLSVNVPAALETLRAFWVDTAWPAIQGVIERVWPVIEGIFAAIRDFVVGTLIPTIQNLYQKWTTEWWPTIQTVLENVWTIIKGIFEELGRWVNDNIVPWIEFLRQKWVDEVWPAIQSAVETMWSIVQPIWESIRAWAAETIPPILDKLKGVFDRVMGGIRDAIQPIKDVWDGFVSAVQGFWEWISNKVFDFKISLPDLPDWAIPGSPLPIHTAWANFAADMPGFAADLSAGPIGQGAGTPGAPGAGGGSTVINIDARGAARGVDRDLRAMVGQVLREYGVKADVRLRTT